MLSVDEINNLEAENAELKRRDFIGDLIIVFSGALLGTVAGQMIIIIIYKIMDAILR